MDGLKDDCDHKFGNMAEWPRKCFDCGKDEFEIQAIEVEKILKAHAEKIALDESLLMCPFCGNQAKLVPECLGHWEITCTNCACVSQSEDSKEKAISAWNTRPQSSDAVGVYRAWDGWAVCPPCAVKRKKEGGVGSNFNESGKEPYRMGEKCCICDTIIFPVLEERGAIKDALEHYFKPEDSRFFMHILDRLLAKVNAGRAQHPSPDASGWRDISSAPTDRPIRIMHEGHCWSGTGRRVVYEADETGYVPAHCQVLHYNGEVLVPIFYATHWQELPDTMPIIQPTKKAGD